MATHRSSLTNESALPVVYDSTPSMTSAYVGRSPYAMVFLVFTLMADVFVGTMVLALNVKYYRMMRRGGANKLSQRTKVLQKMLFRAQLFQLCFFTVFQCLPVLVAILYQGTWLVGLATHIANNDIMMTALAFTSFHSFFDYFSILYFIRPYREFTLKLLRGAMGVCGLTAKGSPAPIDACKLDQGGRTVTTVVVEAQGGGER